MSRPERCADLSELAGEPLGATATTAENWLLVEVPGTWQRDVAAGAGLPEAARGAVLAWLEATPSSRLLFVRRQRRARGDGGLAFVVRASENETGVRRLFFDSPEELADLDLGRDGEPIDRPLVLVCGHGSRDACCALRGTAVYAALVDTLGDDELWFSSHQGGHRFAANVLLLPSGVQLGRVTPENAAPIVADALAGRIDLVHYRGRSVYSAPVQAAELAVRIAEDLDGLSELELAGDSDGRVRFRDARGREYATVVEERVGPRWPASCGAEPEPQRGFVARLA